MSNEKIERIIGIDLGTTNSAAAVIIGGKPTIIPSAEGATVSGKMFPSVVAFTKDGQLLVGEPARRQAITNPEGTIREIKRKMGTDYKANIFKDGQWKKGTYKDTLKIDFGSPVGVKNCFPMDMVELRGMPEMFHLQEAGVYAAGFNWFVDYIIFPLIMLSQIIKKGLLRRFWAHVLVWGINNFSGAEEGVVFLLKAAGRKDGRYKEIILCSGHKSAYDFTAIPVIACLKQYINGSIKKPGLWMMGHIVNPDRLFADMKSMGVKIDISGD